KFEQRQMREKEKERQEEVRALTNKAQDTTGVKNQVVRNNDYVGVSINEIIEDPESRDNILVQDGDVIYIPRKLQTVKVSGEVLSPVNTVYKKHASFKDYISSAGGFTSQAIKRKSYIIYADGSVKSTKSFLGIKSYPKVEPGAEIFVPQ